MDSQNQTPHQWGKNHEALSLKYKLSPSARLLWQWIVCEGIQEEPDLKQFNNWVRRHRGRGYHRDTLKAAFYRLVEAKIINPIKQFTWNLWRVTIKSIADLLESRPRKKSRSREVSRDSQPSNRENTFDGDSTTTTSQSIDSDQQDSDLIARAEDLGCKFSSPSTLSRYPRQDVEMALALLELKRDRVQNPSGWLLQCIRQKWWELYPNWLALKKSEGYTPKQIMQILAYGEACTPPIPERARRRLENADRMIFDEVDGCFIDAF